MIITLVGISGSGKSFVLQQIEEDIFNRDLNSNCDDYVLLRANWEMSVFKLLIRKLKRSLNRSVKSILFNETKAEDVEKFKKVCDEERSGNIYYLEDPCDPKTFYETAKAFLTEHKKKKQVVITIDHIALVRDILGNKKKSMDDLVEYINSLKKEFSNVSFIILSQMNREIEGRSDVRFLAPQRGDIYNSDTMYHISDIVLAIHNPYKLRHEKYMLVNPDRYSYLTEHMENSANKTTNFKTFNRLFWHYMKLREVNDDNEVQDIHIEYFNKKLADQGIDSKKQMKDSDLFSSDNESDVPF